MYLLAKFGGHRSYKDGDISSFINSYMDTLEKIELTASFHHIARVLKSGIPIYNSLQVLDTASRKTRKRRIRTQIDNSKVFCLSCKRKKEFFWFAFFSNQTKYADVQLNLRINSKYR